MVKELKIIWQLRDRGRGCTPAPPVGQVLSLSGSL